MFEAVENVNEIEIETTIKIIQILTKSRAYNGFGANSNVLNYNGQSPLFIAARQGQLQLVKVLIQAGAQPDLNNGELVKDSEAGEVLE